MSSSQVAEQRGALEEERLHHSQAAEDDTLRPAPSPSPSSTPNPRQCNGFSSDFISVDDVTNNEWLLWYRKGSGDPWIEQNNTRIVPKIRFLSDPAQILLRVDGTAWDSHIVQWRYIFLEGYENYSFIRISNFPTLQVVKCMKTGAYFMRSNWMILTSFPATFEEMEGLDTTLEEMAETDSWNRFNGDEATIHNHGYTVPEAPQVVMQLAFALPRTQKMRLYLPAQ